MDKSVRENTQHTPGPWQVDCRENESPCILRAVKPSKSLIAAAPDLLVACKRAVDSEQCLRDGDRGGTPQDRDCPAYDDERAGLSGWCWVCQARAAIAKAEGRAV